MKQLTCLLSNRATQPAVCPLSESVSNRFLIGFCSVSNRFLKQTLRCSARVATLLLVMVASINLMANEETYTFTSKSWEATNSASETANWASGKDGGQLTANQGIQVTEGATGANGTSPISFTNVSKVVVKYCTNASKGVGTIKVQVGSGTEKSFPVTKPSSGGTTLKDAEFTFSPAETGNIKITAECTTNSVYVYSVTITYGGSTPPAGKDVSIDADDELNLTCEESDGTISVTYGEDVADKDINLYNDATCTTSFTGDWFAADFDASGNVDYMVSANTGAAREAYIQIYVLADDAETENTKVIKVTQEEYKEPTGIFNKFTGDNLKEGDYVICVGTDAMKNSVTSNRLDYASVTVSSDKITNPDASVIWHIAPSATDGYWTIYSEDATKYAASTGADNKAQLLESGTDAKSLWSVEISSGKYHFTNKNNSENSKNAKLQKNGTYGFACYAAFSDIVLYQKSNGLETVATPTFSPAAGLYEAEQDITISCTTAGASIYYTTDGTAPSTSSTLYTGTFKLKENKTIKAIAVKEGMNNSSVASAAYTFALPYTSLAEFVSAAPNSESALVLEAADGVVIIGATAKNLYVQDAAGTTMILYNASAAPAWTAGKRIEGKLTGTFTTYQGMNEMVLISWNNANANNDGTMPDPVVLTELTESTFATNFGKYIKMEGQYFQSTSLSSNAVDTKNAGQTITSKMYNTFGTMTGKTLPANDDATVVEGVFIKYYSDYELAVTSIAAGDAKIDVDPVGGADAVNAVALAMNAQVTVTPVAGFATKLNGNPITEATTITIDDAKSITVVSNRDFYTEKSVTYFYKVDESAKAVTVNQPEVGGTIAANPVSGVAGDIITLTYEAAAHYNFGSFSVMAGETPVTVSENAGVYTFEMPNANVTVSATFNIMSQYTATFAAGAATATGSVDPIARYMDELEIQLPTNGFAYAGHVFAGWSDGSTVKQPGENYTLAGDKEFTATWEELPVWAYTYTSNVTLSTGGTNAYKEAVKIRVDDELTQFDALRGAKSGGTGVVKVTVPAHTSALHFHMAGWKEVSGDVTIKKGEESLRVITLVADAGINGSSPYTLSSADPAADYYYNIPIADSETATDITFNSASSKRFALFGVNAVQPAAISIDPEEKNFGEVKQGSNAEQVFTLTPNAFATGTITAEIVGEGAAAFAAGTVANNKVSVTFTPAAVQPYAATLNIKLDDQVMCSAALSGTGITATTPEITVSAEEIDFGKVKQDASVENQQVTVTLNYLDDATASISEGAFTINKTALGAGENTITISATATSMGEKNATITITGEGATTKTIAVKMDVVSKWADVYTTDANVTMSSSQNAKVVINEVQYSAVKANDAANATITLPEGVTSLHFHAASWNDETVTLTAYKGTVISDENKLGEFALVSDGGIKSNSPYTLTGDNYSTEQYFYIDGLTDITEGQVITFVPNDNRYVIYGVNQEGGVLPVLDHITIGGEATKLAYNTTDAFDPVGLTVSAVYTLKGVEQDPVDVTDKVDWTFDPATFNEVGEGLSVTATASFTDGEVTKTDEILVEGITVELATPSISASRVNIEFGEVTQGATVEDIQSKITLKYIAEASVTLSDATAFAIDKETMTETGYLTISAVTSAAVGEHTATITIKDLASETSKVLNLSITINETPRPTIYSLVTDASTLKAGDVIVMAATHSNNTYVNGDLSGYLLTCVEATIANGKLTAIGACEFTLGGEAGAWTLTSTAGKLGATNAKELTYDATKDNFVDTWSISISDNKATIAPNGESYGRFLYNVNSPRFLTYTSDASATMLLPQIYRLGIAEEVSASTLDDHADVTVNEGGNLVINEDVELGDIVVEVGGTVTLNTTKKLTVNNFVIKSTMAGGESGQVLGVKATNFEIKGEAYYDLVLGDEGNPDKWHAFAVPFNVDAINGVYDENDNKLTNEVNYAIMDYHGDVRAQGKYGWKKFRGIMNPGVFYLMTVDGERTTYRMKMNGGFQVSSNTISVQQYAQTSGTDTDAGWNGIANNQLNYVSVDAPVQVLNPVYYSFETMTASSTNFTVGTPFFYQADNATTEITLDAANGENPAYAPRRVGAAEVKNVDVTLANDRYTDHLYLSATDEATNEYQIGRDLVKMTMTNTPAVPQIFANAYGNKLCMVDAPMVNDEATYALSLYAPKAGEYMLAVGETNANVYLMEDNVIIWNLSQSAYPISLPKGNTENYSIILKASQVSTDLNVIKGNYTNKTEKIIYRNQLYLLRDGKVINAIGQKVK